jgi:hypothetical protein
MRVMVSLIFLSLFLYGQTINEQIHALEEATAEERVELMNNIKKQLVSMNTERRMLTIGVLREQLEHNNETKDEANTHEQSVTTEENVEDTETSSEPSDAHALNQETIHNQEAPHIHNELHQHEYQHDHSGEK